MFQSLDNRKKNLHDAWGFNLWYDLILPLNVNIKNVITDLQATGIIDVAEPHYKIGTTDIKSSTSFIPNDAKFIDQWNLKNTGQNNGNIGSDIAITDAWDIEKGTPNVIVAMIDRGIKIDHPDLAQNIWSGVGYNFFNNTNIITPENHGTATAGIVGAITNNTIGVSGIAGGNGNANTGIRLMSCQTFSGSSNGGFAEALIWAADNGACIASNSWVFVNAGVYRISVLDAIDYFCINGGGNVLQGGVAVFAAGNNGEERLTYPGCYEKVIGVAANNNKDKKSSFSNYGEWVDIIAPAGDTIPTEPNIPTTSVSGGYTFIGGTSASTPHVAGVAALIASKLAGKASASDVREILLSTTDNIYSLNPNFIGKLGTGRLNAAKALQKAQQLLNTNTVLNTQSFSATFNCNSIVLNWLKNNSNDDVIVAINNNNTIGIPTNGINYTIGNSIGNSTIIYKGNANTFTLPVTNDNVFYYLKIWSVNTNNQYSFGKQLEILTGPAFTISNVINYTEGIESPSFPTQSLRVINYDNGITWARSNTVKHTGLFSVFMNNYAYTNINQIDNLYLPQLKVNSSDSIILSFWKAYKTAVKTDSLEILASFDCGKNFTSIWKKGGADLATVAGIQTSEYLPIDADWKKEILTFGIPTNTEKVVIAFKNINKYGQNLYIDDINVFTKTLPIKLKEKGVLISPSPFVNNFFIQHYTPPINLKMVSVFNMQGQRLIQKQFNGNADSYLPIDMSAYANGIYQVKLTYTNKSITQKVLKIRQ